MYFALGTAKTLTVGSLANVTGSSGLGDGHGNLAYLTSPSRLRSLVAMKASPDGRLFACISDNTLFLWSLRPDAIIARVTRSTATIDEDGENVDLIWKPDNSSIIVITDKGFLHFYDVTNGNGIMFEYSFAAPHHYVLGAGEGTGIPRLLLKFRMALEIDTGVQCGIGLPSELLVCTKETPSILSLSWAGEIRVRGTIALSSLQFFRDDRDALIQIEASRTNTNLFAWISMSGRAYVARRKSSSDSEKIDKQNHLYEWSGLCFYNSDGTSSPAISASINHAFSLIAVGNAKGDVHVYALSEDLGALRFSHRLSLAHPGDSQIPLQLGAVGSLAWTDDGFALAVGWLMGGCSVWSVYGKLIMSTVSEDTLVQSPDKHTSSQMDQYFHGVRNLFWGPGGHELLLLPMPSLGCLSIVDIFALQFAKSTLSQCRTIDNTRNVLLVTDDKLLVYEGNSWDFDVMNSEMIQWDTIQMPITYITQNWPIMYTSINLTGHYIAIAGPRGLAHYSTVSNKWKLFGNEAQEQGFSVQGGMVWFKTLLVVACRNLSSKEAEIRIYSREMNLDSAHLQHTERLSHPAVCMNSLDNNLLVYTQDNVIRFYTINQDSNKTWLQIHQKISLVGVVVDPLSIKALSWYCLPGEVSLETMQGSPFLLLKNGDLSMLRELEDKTWEHIGLSRNVEYFWISNPHERLGDLYNSLWAFDGAGVKIWANMVLRDMTKTDWRVDENYAESIRINIDYYPLSVLLPRGILMGVDQRMSLQNSIHCALYKLDTKIHLFIPNFVRLLLGKEMEAEAVRFAHCFRQFEYFNHALELLLHQVLEDEAPTAIGFAEGAVLPASIKFVEQFPDYMDIIVQCARKSEVALWDYFFKIVGDAKDLFKLSLERASLSTATSYLIIIQTLEAYEVSSKMAILLLERCFELEDFETGKELIRFLTNIEGSDGISFENFRNPGGTGPAMSRMTLPEQQRANGEISKTEDDLFYLEILISKHARALLSKRRIRSLGRFAEAFSFPLVEWLKYERTRAGHIDDDAWVAVLTELHDQFAWLFPDDVQGIHQLVAELAAQHLRDHPIVRRYSYHASGASDTSLGSGANLLSRRGSVSAVPQSIQNGTSATAKLNGTAVTANGPRDDSAPALRRTENSAPPATGVTEIPRTDPMTEAQIIPEAVAPHQAYATGSIIARIRTGAHTGRRSGSNSGELTLSKKRSNSMLGPSTVIRDPTKHAEIVEIQFLIKMMYEAECLAWTLLLSSMIMDTKTILTVFMDTKNRSFYSLWRQTMLDTHCGGYEQLAQAVEELLSFPEPPMAVERNDPVAKTPPEGLAE